MLFFMNAERTVCECPPVGFSPDFSPISSLSKGKSKILCKIVKKYLYFVCGYAIMKVLSGAGIE